MPGEATNYTIVFVGGPSNGMLATGQEALTYLYLCNYLPGENKDAAIGHRIRAVMPLPMKYVMSQGLDLVKAALAMQKAGIDLENAADAVYSLESIGDPCIMRYVGQHSELYSEKTDGSPSKPKTRPKPSS